MITLSIPNVIDIRFSEVALNRDTKEASRLLNIQTSQGLVSLLLTCSVTQNTNLKVKDYEVKTIIP